MFNWLFLLIFYLPFQVALNPGSGFDLASVRIFIIFLFLIWLIGVRKINFGDFQAVGLTAFLVLICFSLFGAENPVWGFRKILYFLSIFPLYFLTINLVDNWQKVRKIVYGLIAASGLISLIGLLQFLAQFIFGLEKAYSFWAWNILPVFSGFNLGAMILSYPSWLVNVNGETIMRAFSLFSDPHMLSFYLGLILPLLAVLLVRSKKNMVFKIVLYFLLFIVLLLTFSRGAYLAIAAAFLILAFLLWRHLNSRGIVLLLLLSILVFVVPVSPVADRFYSTFDLSEGSNLGRLEMWQAAGLIGLGNFWSGIGLGNYSLSVDSNFDYRNPATAHNLYLDIFSEMGVFALIVWLILIFGTIGYLFQKIKSAKDGQRTLLIGLIGSLAYFSIHSVFESAIFQPTVLSVLMIILGLSAYATKNI